MELGAIPQIQEQLTDVRSLLESRRKDQDHIQRSIETAGPDTSLDFRAGSTPSSEKEKQLYQWYMALSKLSEEIGALEKKEKQLAAMVFTPGDPELVVAGSLFPGVKLTIKEADMRFTDELQHVVVREENGEIVVLPLGDG